MSIARRVREWIIILIGSILAVMLVIALTGCQSKPVAYDQQFCTVIVERYGMERCVAWAIGPGYGKQPIRR